MDGFEAYLSSRPNVELRRALVEFFAPRCDGTSSDAQYDGSLELLADDIMAFLHQHGSKLAGFDADAEGRNILRSDLEAIADQIEDCRESLAQLPFSPAAAKWSLDLDELIVKHRAKTEELRNRTR